MAKLKCFIGNLDGNRAGMVISTSQIKAAKIAGAGINDFRNYWYEEQEFPENFDPKSDTLYTRKYSSNDAWVEGRCPV